MSYLIKRFFRSWKFFLALLLTIVLASTFFSGLNVGADTIAREILDRQLSQLTIDVQVSLSYSVSTDNLTTMVNSISDIEGIVDVEVVSRFNEFALLPDSNETYSRQSFFRIVGSSENSYLYDGLKVVNGSSSLGVNETYLWIGSTYFEDLKLGDILHFNLTLWYYYEGMERPVFTTLPLNLTVVGFVDLEEKALAIAAGYYYTTSSPSDQYYDNILIVDWNKTFAPIINVYYGQDVRFDSEMLIFLDRGSLINMWDIDSSIERMRVITEQIRNVVSPFVGEWVYVYNQLEFILSSYRMVSQSMQIAFIVTSLPVFFVAWYMGTTVSNVSYNLRRREIGLLLTKGFSRRQLLRMFLSEAILIGLVGGLIGLGLSFLITPFIMQGNKLFLVEPAIGRDTVITTFIFSVGLTLFAVFQPARRASKLDIVDALQEYSYVEDIKPYRKRWPWIAFILGSYKIVMWLLGFNTFTLMTGSIPFSNILVSILLGAWVLFDTYLLNYIGPILFFWGFTKIFIRGSLKFQELVARLMKFGGDLSVLSTKNIRRNPARTAAIAFLIAMIIGYSFQIIGSYASEQDYVIRQIRFSVGADISVQISTLQNLSSTIESISNVSGVSSITVEYKFYQMTDGQYMIFVAVDPDKWLNIANYESDLFTGRDIISAFERMKNNNNTIILEKGVADRLKRNLGDKIFVQFGSKSSNLEVVGFFGPEFSGTSGYPYYSYSPSYWSYIPEGFYHSIENDISLPNVRILVKLQPDSDEEKVAKEIRDLKLSNVSGVYSVTETLKQWQENPFDSFLSGSSIMGITGSIEIQRLGVIFAVLAASLGTAIITFVSLSERSREVGLMSVRGLSFKQIVGVMLVENLAVVIFAVFLGALVGLVVVQGNIYALKTFMPSSILMQDYSPIQRHMVFPLDSIFALAACCGLVLASTVIPVILMIRKCVSDLEKIVRET